VEEAGLQGIQPDQVEGVAHKCAVHAGLVSQKLLACYSGRTGCRLSPCSMAALYTLYEWHPLDLCGANGDRLDVTPHKDMCAVRLTAVHTSGLQ